MAPCPETPVCSPACFFPLCLSREGFSRPPGIGPCIVPAYKHNRLHWLSPYGMIPEIRCSMPCFLKECMVLGVRNRMSINIVCLKVYTASGDLGSKYLVHPSVSQKDIAEFFLGNSHGKLTFGHQHHLGFICRAHNSVWRSSRAEFSAYIPAVFQCSIPLQNDTS